MFEIYVEHRYMLHDSCNQPLHLQIGYRQNYTIDATLFQNYSFLVAYITIL